MPERLACIINEHCINTYVTGTHVGWSVPERLACIINEHCINTYVTGTHVGWSVPERLACIINEHCINTYVTGTHVGWSVPERLACIINEHCINTYVTGTHVGWHETISLCGEFVRHSKQYQNYSNRSDFLEVLLKLNCHFFVQTTMYMYVCMMYVIHCYISLFLLFMLVQHVWHTSAVLLVCQLLTNKLTYIINCLYSY